MLTSTTAYLYVHVTNTSFAFPAFPRNIIMCMQSPHISNVHLKHVAKSILYYYPWLPVTDTPLSITVHPLLLMPIPSYYCSPHSITAQRYLSLPIFHSNRPPLLVTLPTASCYSPPLAITNHGFLLLTRSFRSLLTPSCQCPPFLLLFTLSNHYQLLLITAHCFLFQLHTTARCC